MDLKKIFMKDACPTKIGGQAILEGIMMKGADRTATVVRMPDKSLYIKTEKLPEQSKWMKFPIIRGVVAFIGSLVMGTKILLHSADVLESYDGPNAVELEDDKLSLWLEKKFGKDKAWDILVYTSVVLAVLLTVGLFIILPTAVVDFCGRFTENAILLNLIEGVLRIVMFIAYVALIPLMDDIKRVFQFHGAEHKCIHCHENGLELTPENCQSFYTLHPRCGTSFLMFVMIISLILFSFLGWPNLFWRITSRLLLIPVVAGVSYELLRWAGRSDNIVVKVLSMPGILLQKLTTREPEVEHLEVAIAAMKAVMVPADTPTFIGKCDLDGNLIPGTETTEEEIKAKKEARSAKQKAEKEAAENAENIVLAADAGNAAVAVEAELAESTAATEKAVIAEAGADE